MRQPLQILIILISVFHVGFLPAYSQSTMTGADAWMPPKTEDWVRTDTGNSIGPSGANVTWDFSAYSQAATFEFQHSSPFLTPYSSEFPTATLARRNTETDIYEYFISDTSSLELLGIRGTDDWQEFSDAWQYISYPITYPDSMTDPQISLIAYSNPVDTVKRTATSSIQIDGWGSLQLDYITFPNVLRMKQEVDYVDSSYNFATVNGMELYYWWWAPGEGMVALNSNRFNVFKRFAWRTDLSVDREMAIVPASLELFPNPSTGIFNIRYEQKSAAEVLLTVYDGSGKRMKMQIEGQKTPGIHKSSVDLSNVPNGIYLLELDDGASRICRRVSVIGNE